jgi:hypothetical protein
MCVVPGRVWVRTGMRREKVYLEKHPEGAVVCVGSVWVVLARSGHLGMLQPHTTTVAEVSLPLEVAPRVAHLRQAQPIQGGAVGRADTSAADLQPLECVSVRVRCTVQYTQAGARRLPDRGGSDRIPLPC